MKRILIVLLLLALTLSALASCGGTAEPVSSGTEATAEASAYGTEEASGSEPATEPSKPVSEPPTYEYQYEAPADGSFTVCGVPLSEYTVLFYFPGTEQYQKVGRKNVIPPMEQLLSSATGLEWEFTIVKNDRYDTTPAAEHEILMGTYFRREGMPDPEEGTSCYGVTSDGTIYFIAYGPTQYDQLVRTFLEEFFGVPYGTDERSQGCELTECYRELVYKSK